MTKLVGYFCNARISAPKATEMSEVTSGISGESGLQSYGTIFLPIQKNLQRNEVTELVVQRTKEHAKLHGPFIK